MAKRGQNQGSIYYRQPDTERGLPGKWVAAVSLGYVGGKRKRKVIYGDTRADVEKKLRAELSRRDKGLPIMTDRRTVEQFFRYWLEEEVKPNREPLTYVAYESLARLYVYPDLGKVQLEKLTPQHIQSLLARKEVEGVKAPTRKKIAMILRIALNRAMKLEYVGRNVATLVESPVVETTEIVPWTKDEALRFLTVARKDRLGALFYIAMALGLRKSEALGLRWEDIDLDASVLQVKNQLQRQTGKGLVLKTPKSKKSRRRIVLPKPIAAALKEHRKRQLQDRLIAGSRWVDSGHVFTSTIGTPVEAKKVTETFTQLVKAAKVPYQRFHDTRHWCATLLLAQGVSQRGVMELLGHSRISTTMDTYSHIQDVGRQDTADRMGQVFEGFPTLSDPEKEAI